MLADYLIWAERERGLLPNTIRKYRSYLSDLEAEEGDLSALGPEQIRDWLHHKGGSTASFAGRLAATRSFYSWMIRTDQRLDDPTAKIDRPRIHRGLPKPVKNREAKIAQFKRDDYKHVATFLYETGLRLSEAWSIAEEPPVPDELVIRGKGAKERLVQLTDEARKALDALGGMMPGAQRTFQKACQELGFTPHKLRHSLACDLIASGVDLGDVSQILGHASPSTTLIYAAFKRDRLRDAHARRKAS